VPQPKRYKDPAARQKAYRLRLQSRFASLCPKPLPKGPSIAALPSSSRWRAMQEEAARLLADLLPEMQDYRDQRSERWQESDRAQEFEERIAQLESIISDIESLD